MSYLYAGTLRSWQGAALRSTSVTIYTDAAGTTAATGLTDLDGTAISNPVTTDDRGRIAANGKDGIRHSQPTLWYKAAGDTRVMRLLRFCDLTQAAVAVGDYPNAVRDFGATGDGSTDDTAALTDALEQSGGVCILPIGAYKVTDSLPPVNNGGFLGQAGFSSSIAGGFAPPTRIVGNGGFPIFDDTGAAVGDFTLSDLGLIGSQTDSGSKGIYHELIYNWTLRNLFLDSFADQAIWLLQGVAGVFENIWAQNACVKRADHSDYLGAVQFGDKDTHYVSDVHASYVQGYCGGWDGDAGDYASGYHCGLLLAVPSSVLNFCCGSWSETGIKNGYSDYAQFTNCRADHNQGHGFDVSGGRKKFTSCVSVDNSLTADATYSGFRVRNGNNTFIGNHIGDDGGYARHQLYGFEDDSDAGALGNIYDVTNTADAAVSGGLYHITSWGEAPLIMSRNERALDVSNAAAYNGRGAGYTINGAAGLFSGAGSPEGAVTAAVGSLYMRTDGGANTSVYVKESGTGNTGWVAK